MSNGEVGGPSRQDIQLVQNLIEGCLQLYMNQKEAVETLLAMAKIEPGFTELVWQRLEEENREFFEAYHARLRVKQQIMIFNKLLEKQVELMQKIGPAGVVPPPVPNVSHISALHQASSHYVPDHTIPCKLENSCHQIGPNAPNTLLNDSTPVHKLMYTADLSSHTRRMDISPNMLPAQNSQMGMIHGMNGNMIKSESNFSNNSTFGFSANTNILETRQTIGDSNSQHLNEPLLDTDISSFGFLGQIPRILSLSDLTADFSQSSDKLGSYSRSPYMVTDTDHFLDSQGRFECQGDKRLDTISEGLSYEEFGSD